MPGESKSKGTDGRFSNSKSGFNESEFVLVLRENDKTYSKPRRIPRDVALALARDYEGNLQFAKQFGVSVAAAKFIQSKALHSGLLPASAIGPVTIATPEFRTGEVVVSKANTPTGDHSDPQRLPRFFPRIESFSNLSIPADLVEQVAFILSGVDPSLINEPRVKDGSLTLQELVKTSTARISAGSMLQDDHRYILAHLHHLNREAFKQAWDDAQSQASGQANTDIVKLMHKLEKFTLDLPSNVLEDYANKAFFAEVEQRAIEILTRFFRRTRRKIEVIHERLEPLKVKRSFLDLLLRRKQSVIPQDALVQADILEATTDYIAQATKLGRILRSKLLRTSPKIEQGRS